MNRESLSMRGEIALAAQNFVKEINRLREQHGFKSVEIEITSTGASGSRVQIDIHSGIDLTLNSSGEFEPDQWIMKDLTKEPGIES